MTLSRDFLHVLSSQELAIEVNEWQGAAVVNDSQRAELRMCSTFTGVVAPQIASFGAARIRLIDDPGVIDLNVLDRLVCILAEQLGQLVPQSHRNNLLGHITDCGKNYANPTTRGHETNAELAFHSDRCDWNILFYVRRAAVGGELSVATYEDAAAALFSVDPSAYQALFTEFPFDLREERIFEYPKWIFRPILWHSPLGIRGHYIRRFITDSQRHEDCPRLSADQIAALDAFDAVLADLRDKNSFSPSEGELLIVDNFRVMHARSQYIDRQLPSERRLAIRAWVAPYCSERLPDFMRVPHGAIEPNAFRGGVGCGKEYLVRLGTPITKDAKGENDCKHIS